MNSLTKEQELFLYLMKKDGKEIEYLIEQWKYDDKVDELLSFPGASNIWKIRIAEKVLMDKPILIEKCFMNNLNIKDIVDKMNEEYSSIEKQLDKISKSIFTIHKDTDLINHEINYYEEEKEVKEIYEKSINKEIIVLDKHLHFTDYLPKTEAIYVIFPSNRGGYSAQGVPINSDTVELKRPFPASWTQDLPEYLTFCHSSRFLISARTLDDIIYACNIALKDGE